MRCANRPKSLCSKRLKRVLAMLEILGCIEPRAGAAYTPEEEAGI